MASVALVRRLGNRLEIKCTAMILFPGSRNYYERRVSFSPAALKVNMPNVGGTGPSMEEITSKTARLYDRWRFVK